MKGTDAVLFPLDLQLGYPSGQRQSYFLWIRRDLWFNSFEHFHFHLGPHTPGAQNRGGHRVHSPVRPLQNVKNNSSSTVQQGIILICLFPLLSPSFQSERGF